MNILHISPHSDDEALGCPAILLALTRYHQVDNLLLQAGPERRIREAKAAASKSGITLLHRPTSVSSKRSREENEQSVLRVLPNPHEYDLWISPQPQDGHPTHEAVGRALQKYLPEGSIWWQWGLWRELARANILYSFGEEEMQECQAVLRFFEGEIERNNYPCLLRARAEALAVLAPERLWGWGSAGQGEPYAEVLLEVQRQGGWRMRGPRELDPRAPLAGTSEWQEATEIIERSL